MSGEYFYGAVQKATRKRAAKPVRPMDREGVPATGRIVRLFVGQGHGFIRLADDRDVFFHRSDVQEGTSFNHLEVGDPVRFELLDDTVSGRRAVHVRRSRPQR
jgi:cold shock CspA family protein